MIKTKNFELIFFLAIFLLPTAGVISGILLIALLIKSLYERRSEFLKDKWNYPFIIATALMIISCLVHMNYGIDIPKNDSGFWLTWLSWLGLFNWIPMFLCFWGFQPYLESSKQREFFSYALLLGSLPVIFSGFAQYLFNITGPFETLGGLIIWFQRPIEGNGGLTGVFNASNYAGSWFNIVWPFCLALLIENSNLLYKKFTFILISFSVFLSIILTNSRNAWLGMILSIPLLLGRRSLIWLTPILITALFGILIAVLPFIPINLQNIMRFLIPDGVWSEFIFNQFIGREGRIEIWGNSLKFLEANPFFGIGPGSFPIFYESNHGVWIDHAHNLFLNLSLNYGVPVSIIIFFTVLNLNLKLLLKDTRMINKSLKVKFKSYNDRAWWVSSLIFIISQFLDVQYYDGRLSIIFWIILAGCRSQLKPITLENNNSNY